MSVVDVLARSPARPDAYAVVGDGALLSYEELDRRVDERADALGRGGTARGDVLPLVAAPGVDGIVDLLACWRVGAVPVPLNARLTEAERAAAAAELAEARVPARTQVVLWTSGTSGRPRGVALSWGNLEASAQAAAERLDLRETDVWVASLSPAHVGGLALVTRSLLLGGALVVPPSHDAAGLSRALDGEVDAGGGAAPESLAPTHLSVAPTHPSVAPTHPSLAPTHLSVVPTQLLRLLDHREGRPPPDRLRCVLVGGAHAPAQLVARALGAGWPIALTYGATEMSSQMATAPPELTARRPGTVGPPLEGVELRVDGGGELLARGPTRALAYVGRDGGALADSEGWYRTGDLGRIDEDGNLWITGRRIDRIVSGGVTVDAVEVEEALREHPAVIDACVVGVPDEEWGERVAAWVEPVVGELDLEEIDRHLRERLSPAKLPRLWRVEGGLPRNANGKVDRGEVRGALERERTRG